MKYAEYRNNLKSGDVVAWSGKGFKPALIRFFTKSEYTHVGVVWTYRGRVFVIEQIFPEARVFPLSELLPFHVLHLNKVLTAEAEDVAFSYLGITKYSNWEAIKSLVGLNNSPDKWQCVEFCKAILKANGTEISCRDVPSDFVKEIQKISPSMVYLE